MKKRYRWLAVVATFAMALVLAGCSAQTNAAQSSKNSSSADSATQNSEDASGSASTQAISAAATDSFAPYLTEGLDYLILVNQSHPYEFGGEYDQILQKNLVYFADARDGDFIGLDKGALAAFTKLRVYLDNNYDFQIGIFDAYRDYDMQKSYYTKYLRMFYGDLKDDPDYDSLRDWQSHNPLAEPGYSETHTGLLFNVIIKHDRGDEKIDAAVAERIGYEPDWVWYTETPERQSSIERFKILHEHLADFGFIDRFPAGKETSTGVPAEPYQIRFVGSSKVAHEIMDNGMTLEEYLGERSAYDPYAKPSAETLEKYLSN